MDVDKSVFGFRDLFQFKPNRHYESRLLKQDVSCGSAENFLIPQIDNKTLEETVFAEENIPVIENEMVRNKNEILSIEDKLKTGEAFFSKSPKKHQEILEEVKDDVCNYLGINEVPIPHCEYKSFSNSLKSMMNSIASGSLFTTSMFSTYYSIVNPSLTALGVASILGYLTLKSSKLKTIPVTQDSFVPFYNTITLTNRNYQNLLSSFAHEYTHVVHLEHGVYKNNFTENLSFSEGHARMVEIEMSKKYAQEKKNEAHLYDSLTKKGEDLAHAYILSSIANGKEIKYDILPHINLSSFVDLNKRRKNKLGFSEPHAVGTAYFSILNS